jgi:lactoylglutathione lyase
MVSNPRSDMPFTPIKAIAHWALKVKDLEASLKFYRDRLGFAEMMRLYRDDGTAWLVYLRVTDTQFVELFPDGEGERAPGKDAVAINHICLEVPSVDEAAAALEKLGITLTIEPKLGLDGNRQCWFEDPDGNRIELMQMLPGNMQEEAISRLKG